MLSGNIERVRLSAASANLPMERCARIFNRERNTGCRKEEVFAGNQLDDPLNADISVAKQLRDIIACGNQSLPKGILMGI